MPIRAFSPMALAGVAALCAPPASAQQILSCDQFMDFGSTAAGSTFEIRLVNSSGSRRGVMWMDAGGTPVHIVDLNVGQSTLFTVAAGDVVSLVDGPGNCVEMFRVTAGQKQYIIQSIATGEGGD